MTGLRLRVWIIVLGACLSACSTVRSGVPGQALPAVSPVPAPSLPPWIGQISPQGEAKSLAQVRIIFNHPLVPLQALEDASQQQKLALFTIDPPLPGGFRFLTPRMVGFQQDAALPLASRIKVTLHSGLSDLSGHSLAAELSWTFTTAPLNITGLPSLTPADDQSGPPQVVGLTPAIRFTSNVQLDLQSLADHVTLVSARTNAAVPVTVAADTSNTPSPNDEDQPQMTYDASVLPWPYLVTPKQPLDRDTVYTLTVARGLMPARGNVAGAKDFTGQIKTFGALTFDGLTRAKQTVDRFAGGSPQLQFSNPLVADSVQKNLSMQPVPRSTAGLWQVNDGDTSVTVNTAWLAPKTNYTITIGPGVADSFGQTLGETKQVTLSTGNLTANFWMPDGINIFPADDNLQLNISAVNLAGGKYKAVFKVLQPGDIVANPDPYGAGNGAPLFGDPSTWPSFSVNAVANQVVNVAVPLRAKLGGKTGLLAYGAMATTQQYQPVVQLFGFVQLTDLGVFAQWFPTQGLIRVARLSDGSNVAGAAVSVYTSSGGVCAAGTTGAGGSLTLGSFDMARCLAGSLGSYGGPTLVAVARSGADWAYARTDPFSGAYGYGIDTQWDRGTPQSRGTIFSDRSLYQPGEKAHFSGAAYYLQSGALHQDRDAIYHLTLTAPDGSTSNLGTQTADGYGMFTFSLPLRTNQPLGYYALSAKGPSGDVISGDFRVAEFKPPNFKVALTLNKSIAYPGGTVLAKATSSYLFGSPVTAGQASYYVTRQQTTYSPNGWDDYTFGRQWLWPEQPPSVTSDVVQSKQALGDGGAFEQTISVDASVPYPLTYEVDAQVVDVSNLSVADSKTFTVLPSDELIGLRNDWIGTAGKPVGVSFVVTDPNGAPQRGRDVKFELQQMTYGSATQIVEGGESDVNAVQYKTVATAQASSSDGAQSVSLTAPAAGPYRIRANFADATDDTTATDSQIWVTGPGEVDWGEFDRNVLQVKLDKKVYHVGDMATALVQSPYPSGELYFAVIRDKILQSSVRSVSGSAPEVRFRITPDMLPNAAVEAVLVRRGKALRTLAPGSIDSLARFGFAPFAINLDDKYLKVTLAPAHATLEPGQPQTVTLAVRDARGRPQAGELAVMVVNETILQLTGYRPPDLVQTVYALQDISTTFADNRPNVVLAQIPSPLQKGYGFGGGFLAAPASTTVRTNFQPLAYYNGSLHTDAQGKAHFTFKLPDDLTTWRIMAVAVGAGNGPTDFRFGNADTTFVTSKPLVTNPLLPQFARPGDVLSGGVSVTNISAGSGTLSIAGAIAGPLAFKPSGTTSATANFSAAAPATTGAYRFTMLATGVGTAKVKFSSDVGAAADAFEVPLNIRNPLSVMESVVESGVTASNATIPVNVGAGVATDSGGLEIDLSSTLLPEITVPAMRALSANDMPFLEPAASRLFMSADLKLLARRYSQSLGSFNPDASAAAALAQLVKLQRADGGFGWCPCFPQSDVFVTPYAARSLAAAVAAGIAVNPSTIARVRGYLERKLADPGVCSGIALCTNRLRLDILVALGELGETRDDHMSDIYGSRDQFDLLGQVELARYLLRLGGWRSQGAAMADKLQQIIYLTGRTATINYPEEWGWLASPTVMRAQALRLYIARRADPDFLDKLLESLLALRRNGTWQDSYDTAEALSALIDYGALQPQPPNFTALSTLGGTTLQSVTFSGYKVTTDRRVVPMAQLPAGSNDLVLAKSGQGRLHYLVSYTYRLQGNQPGQLAGGLRITREVRPANKDEVLAKMGLNAPNDPLTLAPGEIFDVGLEIIADHPVDHVVITDELPAGLEAVDTTFKTSTPYFEAMGDSWEMDYQTIYSDRIVAYASRLEAGVYALHYLVRSVTPGTYLWPGAEVHLQYAPEEFGRTSTSTLIVSQ